MTTREHFWVDRPVQGVLIGRVLVYWGIGVTYLAVSAAIYQYYQSPELSIGQHLSMLPGQFGPWIPSAVLILPLVMFDIVRLSNLFVGPIYRLRKHLDTLADNPDCPPLSFRDGDYWQDLAAPINCMQLEFINLRKENIQLKRQLELKARAGKESGKSQGLPIPDLASDQFLMKQNENSPTQ